MYEQIRDALRQRIADGTLPAGAQLPTEADLMAEYGVGRGTVREALGKLVNEGLVVPMRPGATS